MSIASLIATEREYQSAVIGWLELYNWMYFHDTDSRRNRSGLPDLIATDGRTLLMAELKSKKGQIRPEQQRWSDALDSCERLVTGIYRPTESESLFNLISSGGMGRAAFGVRQ